MISLTDSEDITISDRDLGNRKIFFQLLRKRFSILRGKNLSRAQSMTSTLILTVSG
jgi:hypothetical protein